MVSGVTATTDSSAAAAAMKKSIGMNKDDFLKLFITQLKNQDPLKPQDPQEMLAQLAQLTQVEQSYNTNTALNNLLTAQNNASTMSSVSFIGKLVTANGNSIVFDGSSTAGLQFNMAVPTDSAKISITDANGKVVRTATISSLKSGDTGVAWDGRDNAGNLLPAGVYSFSVTGTTKAGAEVAATTYTTGVIDGVSIVSGVPMLTVGQATIALSDIISVKGV